MIFTDKYLEAIREAAKNIDYGKITINAGTSEYLELIIEKRIRLPKEERDEQDSKHIISRNNKPRY